MSLNHQHSFRIIGRTEPFEALPNSASSCSEVGFVVGWVKMIGLFVAFEKACTGLASAGCITFEGTC